MNKIQKSRLIYVSLFCAGLTVAACLIFYALRQNINVFLTPSQINSAHLKTDYHFRLGGMVKQGSLKRNKENLDVHFVVTDLKQEIIVNYVGVLPDLFREGKGVVAEGSMNSRGEFDATLVLAKHDENYMPSSVYKAMQKSSALSS